jgi:WD40 repeat protein
MDITNNYEYKVGGSLSPTALCYVNRAADRQLLDSLTQGELCYVLNCRQMGKSSLKARTIKSLEAQGFACAAVDVTKLGTRQVTPDRWYKGLVVELARVFNLTRAFDLKAWRSELSELSAIQQLSLFIEDILLTKIPQQQICIFLEEIDNVKSLDFPTDDLFALIRSCYEQRGNNPAYQRLTFCLLGVAAPSDLMVERQRTPFNIGRSIDLTGFTFTEAQPALTPGLRINTENPDQILAEVLDWTGGQPFLTQKLCKLVAKHATHQPPNVAAIVQTEILNNWESQDNPPHLKTIRDRLQGSGQRQVRLLTIYQQILLQGAIEYQDIPEHIELQLSGLVVKQNGQLQVYNPIYQRVFDRRWVERALLALRPEFYSVALAGWLSANQAEESWLLRGQVLQEAQQWAADKSLSDDDYRFLAASRESAQQEVQKRLDLEAEAAGILAEANQILVDANQTLAQANQKAKRLIGIGGGFLVFSVIGLGLAVAWASSLVYESRVERIKSLSISSTALLNANQEIDALVAAVKAGKRMQALNSVAQDTRNSVRLVLQKSIFQSREQNRLEGHTGKIRRVKLSDEHIVTASEDSSIRIWNRQGREIRKIAGSRRLFRGLNVSPDGKTIAAVDARNNTTLWDFSGQELASFLEADREDNFMADLCFIKNGQAIVTTANQNTVKIRQLSGATIGILKGHTQPIWSMSCDDRQRIIITADRGGVVKIWDFSFRELGSFSASKSSIFGVALSPDGQTITTASGDKLIKIWTLTGQEIQAINGHDNYPTSVIFSPDGKTIVTTSSDRTTRFWSVATGQEVTALKGHSNEVFSASFSADGQTLATASGDTTVKLWNLAATRQKTAIGHRDSLWSLDFHPKNPQMLASAGDDQTVKFWNLAGEQSGGFPVPSPNDWNRISALRFSPNGQMMAMAGADKTIGLWDLQGKNLDTLRGHQEIVVDVSFSPDGRTLASASHDGTVKLWNINGQGRGQEISTIVGNGGKVESVSFNHDGTSLVSAHDDGSVKLWNLQGQLLKSRMAHQLRTVTASFSPHGKVIASGSDDKTIQLWHLDTGTVQQLKGHTADVTKVSFSPDGQTIASASSDSTIRLWSVSSGEELKTIPGQGYPFWNVRFSVDGKTIAAVSDNGLVQLWSTETPSFEQLMVQGCDWLGKYLQSHPRLGDEDLRVCDR